MSRRLLAAALLAAACGGGSTVPAPGAGGAGGDGACGPAEHRCDGVCLGNSPESGCLGSSSCEPCPEVASATAICTAQGSCDFVCEPPLDQVGNGCGCPTECCGSADCEGGYKCEGGSCVCPTECCASSECPKGQACEGGSCVPYCDLLTCIMDCMGQGFAMGLCIDDVCQCAS